MHSLLTVMGVHQKFKKGIEAGPAHKQPVERNEQRPGQEMVLFALHAGQQVEIDVEKVAKDEAERAQVEHRPREEPVIDFDHRMAKDDICPQQKPHQGIDEDYPDGAAYHHLKREQAVQASFLEKLNGRPHMDEVGLHVTLDPASAPTTSVSWLANVTTAFFSCRGSGTSSAS